MTKEEKLAVIGDLEDKAYKALSGLTVPDMTTDKPHTLFHVLNDFRYLKQSVMEEDVTITLDKSKAVPFVLDKVQQAAEDTDLVETAAEEPEDVATEVSAKTYSRDEVKVTLNRLHREGKIDVAELFEQIGYTKMSDIPDSELGKLMALAGVE